MSHLKVNQKKPGRRRRATAQTSSSFVSMLPQAPNGAQLGKKSSEGSWSTANMVKAIYDKTIGLSQKVKEHHDSGRLSQALKLSKPKPKPGYKQIAAAPNPGDPQGPFGHTVEAVANKKYQIGSSMHPAPVVAQHLAGLSAARTASVGVAEAMAVPSVGWSMFSGIPGEGGHDSITLEGTDYMTALAGIAVSSPVGTEIFSVFINPRTLGLARLSTFATLFERFYFESFEIIYVTACASSTAGGMVMYYERDPGDVMSADLGTRIQQAFGHQGVVATNYWTGCVAKLPPNPGEYFIDAGTEIRLSQQAVFHSLAEVPSTNSVPGVFMVRYRCRLWQSKIDTSSITPYVYSASSTNATTPAAPFGAAITPISPPSNLPVTYGFATNSIFTLNNNPAPAYMVYLQITGTVLTAVGNQGITFPLSQMAIDTGTYYGADGWNVNAGATINVWTGVLYTTNFSVNQQFKLSFTGYATTVSAAYIAIVPVPYPGLYLSRMRLDAKVNKLLKDTSLLKKALEEMELGDRPTSNLFDAKETSELSTPRSNSFDPDQEFVRIIPDRIEQKSLVSSVVPSSITHGATARRNFLGGL